MALGIVLLQAPGGAQFLMGEVSLYGRVLGGCVFSPCNLRPRLPAKKASVAFYTAAVCMRRFTGATGVLRP